MDEESRDFLFDYQRETMNGHNSEVTGQALLCGKLHYVSSHSSSSSMWKFGKISLVLSLRVWFTFSGSVWFVGGERKRERSG